MQKLGVLEDTLFIPRLFWNADRTVRLSSWAVVWRQPITDVITERHTGMPWICLM